MQCYKGVPNVRTTTLVLLAACGLCCGCAPAPEADYVHCREFDALNPKVQTAIRSVLLENCGTPQVPRMLGSVPAAVATDGDARPAVPAASGSTKLKQQEHLLAGKKVYLRRCVQCHGATGDGNGPAAAMLYPRPRDYRRGIFKFTSTTFGSKPRRDDLLRTLRRGIPGTSMPSFELLPDKELQAVLDYVLVLTHRGELEYRLAQDHQGEEEFDPDTVASTITDIGDAWAAADGNEIVPLSPQIQFTAEHVALGQKAFLTKGCSKCHGDDGRGQTPENLKSNLLDAWQFPTRAADLSSGMLHGGPRPIDVYRRVSHGVNGTPMPGFSEALAAEPETLWHLVAFIQHKSNQRRRGELPVSGELTPFQMPPSGTAKPAAP